MTPEEETAIEAIVRRVICSAVIELWHDDVDGRTYGVLRRHSVVVAVVRGRRRAGRAPVLIQPEQFRRPMPGGSAWFHQHRSELRLVFGYEAPEDMAALLPPTPSQQANAGGEEESA